MQLFFTLAFFIKSIRSPFMFAMVFSLTMNAKTMETVCIFIFLNRIAFLINSFDTVKKVENQYHTQNGIVNVLS